MTPSRPDRNYGKSDRDLHQPLVSSETPMQSVSPGTLPPSEDAAFGRSPPMGTARRLSRATDARPLEVILQRLDTGEYWAARAGTHALTQLRSRLGFGN